MAGKSFFILDPVLDIPNIKLRWPWKPPQYTIFMIAVNIYFAKQDYFSIIAEKSVAGAVYLLFVIEL